MKRVEHSASPCPWDDRALYSCGSVTVEWDTAKRIVSTTSVEDGEDRRARICESVACVLAIAAKSTVGG